MALDPESFRAAPDMTLDLRSLDPRFDSRPPRSGADLVKLFTHTHTHVPLSPSSINLVPAKVGKYVTVGLASH